jgi:hypothetical protein
MGWLFRVPLWRYRANLGWLFGHRLARLTHRGRRSGQIRQAVVDVVRYEPRTRGSLPAGASESQRRAAIAATIRGVVFWPGEDSGSQNRDTVR